MNDITLIHLYDEAEADRMRSLGLTVRPCWIVEMPVALSHYGAPTPQLPPIKERRSFGRGQRIAIGSDEAIKNMRPSSTQRVTLAAVAALCNHPGADMSRKVLTDVLVEALGMTQGAVAGGISRACDLGALTRAPQRQLDIGGE